jgi:autotransporter-associated beta strand protein
MKYKFPSVAGLTSLVLVLPATAEVIYSNLQDISIPNNFDGVYLNIETGAWNTNAMSPVTGWDINAFFGGSALWNAPSFQPVRLGTTSTSAVANLAEGALVTSGSTYSTFVQGAGGQNPGGAGYGASETHLGSGAGQFQAGEEGYLGFRLNGTNYGWMRVVFTNNTGGALIKDWAYDTTGASIAVGNVKLNGSDMALNSGNDNVSLGSAISDANGATNVVKSGNGTTNLNGANSYTGSTNVAAGRLNVNGSIHANSQVVVESGATLGGDGVINGNVTLDGILRVGQGGSTDRRLEIGGVLNARSGSSMIFRITDETSYDQLMVGSLDLSSTNLVIEEFGDTTMNTLASGDGANFLTNGATFYKLIEGTTLGMFANVTETMSASELAYYGLSGTQYKVTLSNQTFWVAQGSTYLVAIPETSLTLLGSLGALAMLRRRRS